MKAYVVLGFVTLSALAGCGGDSAGTLVLTVDALPAFVRDTSILVTGSVTRTPAKATDVIVNVAGGAVAAAETLRTNKYTVRVRLTVNAANQLAVSATGATGSTSNVLNVTMRQDGQPPAITQATPADTSDNVALSTPIQVTFNEKVVVGAGGGIRLTRQGATIAGSTAVSGDSLTLTFTPSATLSPNSIYRISTTNVTDVAANAASSTAGTCFVTTPTGATATMSFTDAASDTLYGNGGPDALLAPNLVAARFAREGTLFSGVFRFTGPRIFSATALNQGGVLLELDTDRDSTTGFWTFKDTLFFASTAFGPDYQTKYSSGTKAEYVIDLEPTSTSVGVIIDSAFVGRKTSAINASIDGLFVPGTCGAMIGFVVPFSILGNDDGQMNGVAMGIAGTTTTFLVDPMPIFRSLGVDVRTPGPAPVWSGPSFVSAPSQTRTARIRQRPIQIR